MTRAKPAGRARLLVVPPRALPPGIRWRDRMLTLGAWSALMLAIAGLPGIADSAHPGSSGAFITELLRSAMAAGAVVAFLLLWGAALSRGRRSSLVGGPAPRPFAARGLRADALSLGVPPGVLRAWRGAATLNVVVAPNGRVLPEEYPGRASSRSIGMSKATIRWIMRST